MAAAWAIIPGCDITGPLPQAPTLAGCLPLPTTVSSQFVPWVLSRRIPHRPPPRPVELHYILHGHVLGVKPARPASGLTPKAVAGGGTTMPMKTPHSSARLEMSSSVVLESMASPNAPAKPVAARAKPLSPSVASAGTPAPRAICASWSISASLCVRAACAYLPTSDVSRPNSCCC